MTVYLLHFLEPIGNPSTPHGMAQHYYGWSPEPAERIARHASGDGAKIIRYVMEAGIGFVVAQTWDGGPELEKRLKRRKDAPRVCRVCREERREQQERDELLAQMDWERELTGEEEPVDEYEAAKRRAYARVDDHEAGRHEGRPTAGCWPCYRELFRTSVEAEEAAETIESRQ